MYNGPTRELYSRNDLNQAFDLVNIFLTKTLSENKKNSLYLRYSRPIVRVVQQEINSTLVNGVTDVGSLRFNPNADFLSHNEFIAAVRLKIHEVNTGKKIDTSGFSTEEKPLKAYGTAYPQPKIGLSSQGSQGGYASSGMASRSGNHSLGNASSYNSTQTISKREIVYDDLGSDDYGFGDGNNSSMPKKQFRKAAIIAVFLIIGFVGLTFFFNSNDDTNVTGSTVVDDAPKEQIVIPVKDISADKEVYKAGDDLKEEWNNFDVITSNGTDVGVILKNSTNVKGIKNDPVVIDSSDAQSNDELIIEEIVVNEKDPSIIEEVVTE